jgi:hypothetical protein
MARDTIPVTVWGCLTALVSLMVCGVATGQEPPAAKGNATQPPAVELAEPDFPSTYSPLDAGQDAYRMGEKERREGIARQLDLNHSMTWYSGVPGYRYPPSLESIYAYPNPYAYPLTWRAVRRGAVAAYRTYPYAYRYYPYPHVFEPWPRVPGDIYGYPYVDRVEQPLGHKVIVTGPNSYVYRPVYPWDVKPKQAPRPPSAASPTLPPPPSPNDPAAEPVPAPPAEGGPREF